MAKPIKETPILKGDDARRFTERANNVEKISVADKTRMKNNYEELSKRVKFN